MGEVACGSPWLQTLNFNSLLIPNKTIFAVEITVSLIVLGQHFGGPYGDPEKTPNDSETGEQTGTIPTLSPLLLTASLLDPGV